jgi:hypothetical protein
MQQQVNPEDFLVMQCRTSLYIKKMEDVTYPPQSQSRPCGAGHPFQVSLPFCSEVEKKQLFSI